MILVVTGSRALADSGSAERWAFDLLHAAVAHADTLVTGDARGPDAWALTCARTAGRRWAVYGLDGRVVRGHAAPVADVPQAERAAWCDAYETAARETARRMYREAQS